MIENKLITVLMPVYNAEKYLMSAINSILRQTYQNFEFLIINDGSTDRSEEIIKSYHDERIRYIKNEKNLKLIATLNKGVELAKGEYIARMDADDIALPCMLWNAMSGFLDAPYAAIVNQRDYEMDDDGLRYWKRRFLVYLKNDSLRYTQLFCTQILHPGIVVKTEVLKQYRYIEASHTLYREDFDLWKRMLVGGCYVKVLASYAILHRRAKNSITNTQHADYIASAKVLKTDLRNENFEMSDDVVLFLISGKLEHILLPIRAYKELVAFFRCKYIQCKIDNFEFRQMKTWALQNVTVCLMKNCKCLNDLIILFFFLLRYTVFLYGWFWKNIFYYITNSDKNKVTNLCKEYLVD